jgi:light-regulated signal transduction histidine kinase (bacteriophytochrome)
MAVQPEIKDTSLHQYDSEFCGSIPLHLINLIQPHGALLVLNKDTLVVAQVSENVTDLLATAPEGLLGRPLADLLPGAQLEELREKIDRWGIRDRIPMDLSLATPRGEVRYRASVHPKSNYVLLELEPVATDAEASFMRAYQEVKYITAAIKEGSDAKAVCQIAALEIKQLSGFDRVMIYQFDYLWNGTVIAEARENDLEPYYGLRFPASDVPRQTRELYYRNPYRLIPDRDFAPVRLRPVVNPLTRAFTDLSESTLRGVPNVHVEYLRNMDVMASMSTPIIIDNRLWGLISCHHKTAGSPTLPCVRRLNCWRASWPPRLPPRSGSGACSTKPASRKSRRGWCATSTARPTSSTACSTRARPCSRCSTSGAPPWCTRATYAPWARRRAGRTFKI